MVIILIVGIIALIVFFTILTAAFWRRQKLSSNLAALNSLNQDDNEEQRLNNAEKPKEVLIEQLGDPNLTSPESSPKNENKKPDQVNEAEATAAQDAKQSEKNDEPPKKESPLKIAFRNVVTKIKETLAKNHSTVIVSSSSDKLDNSDELLEQRFFGNDREKKFEVNTDGILVPNQTFDFKTGHFPGIWENKNRHGVVVSTSKALIDFDVAFKAGKAIDVNKIEMDFRGTNGVIRYHSE